MFFAVVSVYFLCFVMKVLLFSNDLMPFADLPTSGGGMRCYQLLRGLEAQGIEVVSSMPGFTYLAEKHFSKIPEEQKAYLWRWETQDEIYRRVKPDAVIYSSNWDHYGLSRKPDVPLIIDLHGSRLIETTMWNSPVSTDRKVAIFSKADCLLCAGKKQRSYFCGWLVQAGRVPDKEHFIRYIPISMSPEIPLHESEKTLAADHPLFVSGGGWFPWQNQAKTVFAICNAVKSRALGAVQIYGTPHETNNSSPEELRIREIYKGVLSLAESSTRIRVNGYIGRDELVEVYRRADVAVEAMQYNLERELAFTTRTIEYLWCGLPVIYNNYSEISEHIKEYDAGWTIDPSSDADIAETLAEIFSRPDVVQRKSANAQKLVRDRFSWDKTILPLVDFLNNPERAKVVEPATGTVSSRPAFLSPRGSSVDLSLGAGKVLEQEFVIPAEDIICLEIPISFKADSQNKDFLGLECRLKAINGRCYFRRVFAARTLPESGKLRLDFPTFRSPKAGEKVILSLRVLGESSSSVLLLRGLLRAQYPFSEVREQLNGVDLMGSQISVAALLVNFVPGRGKLYTIKHLVERAWWMVRRGEWRRLYMAVLRRSPEICSRVKRMVLSHG